MKRNLVPDADLIHRQPEKSDKHDLGDRRMPKRRTVAPGNGVL